MLRRFIEKQETYLLLSPFLSNVTGKNATSVSWLEDLATGLSNATDVLDLGCGEGNSVDLFSRIVPSARWHGVDIESSPEVDRRNRPDLNVMTFDGIHLPYDDDFFDVVHSNQVLEHVRYPDRLIPEVNRTLKPGGLFIGSVSYLEPHHSRSIFNFTPYGLALVIKDAGLELRELRPGIDAPSLLVRQMLGAPRFLNFLFQYSPLHLAIGFIGLLFRLPAEMTGFLRVQYSGQFCFLAAKTRRRND
jgi:SAM-dependent methyltransferase